MKKKAVNTVDALAAEGGPRAVTTQGPATWSHGPAEIGKEEIAAVRKVLERRMLFRFGLDPKESYAARFEDLMAKKTGARFALAMNSGTSALIAGLVGLGVSQGDEVLVPAYTYIATAAAVLALGAFPVIVDVDRSLMMDPRDLAKKITPRSRAVIPVHMRGSVCDMERILAVARRHKLRVLEDCAQANGATYRGRHVGTLGDAGAFSLQQSKVITAGEGGILITSDREIFERAAFYHDSAYMFWMEKQGTPAEQRRRQRETFLGQNFRMPELIGAVAYVQLKKRDRILARTRAIKRRLWTACEAAFGPEALESSNDRQGDCGLSITVFCDSSARAVELARWLKAEGVNCGTRFSKEIPDRHVYYFWNYIMEKRTPHRNGFPWTSSDNPCKVHYDRDMCPQTIYWMERAVFFPITQVMSDEYIRQVCAAIRKVGHWMFRRQKRS